MSLGSMSGGSNNVDEINIVSGRPTKIGRFLIGLSGGTAVALSVVCLPFVLPAIRPVCLPYVPATATQIKNVMCALAGRSGRLVDLGSGDGRIVIEYTICNPVQQVLAAAKNGFVADGVELNPWLVAYSKLQAFRLGLGRCTRFYCRDLWKVQLQPYQNVVVFGVQEMMPDLEVKLEKELHKDVCVVACRFPLPTWPPAVTLGTGMDTVWVYRNPWRISNSCV